MGKNDNKSRDSQVIREVQSTPAPLQPQSENFYENGFLRSSRQYQPSSNTYFNYSSLKPEELAIQNSATTQIKNLVDQAGQSFNLSPESIAGYKEAFAAPQRQALNEAYNQAKGAATNSAAASGTMGSVGFNKYMANEVERNRAQGLADIENNAKLLEYDIPRRILAPFGDAFNLYNAALQGQQSQTMSQLEPIFQGSQIGNSTAQAAYGNLLNRQNLLLNSLNSQPQQRSGGFFGGLFGA